MELAWNRLFRMENIAIFGFNVSCYELSQLEIAARNPEDSVERMLFPLSLKVVKKHTKHTFIEIKMELFLRSYL